jgi:predicted AAA+ superfamily ATPase
MYIPRKIEKRVFTALENNPVVALIGPRQCGKSTFVKHILGNYPDSIYLDMERPSDLQKLEDAEWFLSSQKVKLICIDEVQRKPALFPLLSPHDQKSNIKTDNFDGLKKVICYPLNK